MMLIWLGESLKKLDKLGAQELLAKHPKADWKGAKGMRDILSHDYGRADPEAVVNVCRDHLEPIRTALMHNSPGIGRATIAFSNAPN